jgi:flagellar motor switch protein FliN/FliY
MPAGVESILTLEVPVIVQIGERMMPVEEVLSMAPGSIIELPKPSSDDLEILVNNKVIGTGSAVKVGENFGVRVGYIGDLKRRLSAMQGGQAPGEPAPQPDDEPPVEGPGPGT